MFSATIPTDGDARVPSGVSASDMDRREYDRHAEPPLHVSCLPVGVIDVSLGGICLALSAPLKLEEPLELILTEGLCYTTQSLAATVVWQSRNRVGLRWVDPTPRETEWLQACIDRWEKDRVTVVIANKL